MPLRDCLMSAAEQGEISAEEAAAIADAFDAQFARNRKSMGDNAAAAKARKDVEDGLRAQSAEKARRAKLTEAARLRVKSRLTGYRNRDGKADIFDAAMGLLSHYGFRDGSSVRGHSEAIIAASHAKMSDLMFALRRKGVFGRRNAAALETDLVKELHGEASGNAAAKALAQAASDVFEDLRQRFNAAGGAIAKLDRFGLPHSHDRAAVKAAGRAAWKKAIRPLIDPEQMMHPLTREPVGPDGIDDALDHVYASIVSEGRAHLTPKLRPTGKGAIASQRREERFIAFRDAESWLGYHRQFGRGSVTEAIFNHVNGMAKDIAAMELLGPNPAAMVEFIKQAVSREIGRKEAGLASLAGQSLLKDSQAQWAEFRIDALYQSLRGNPTVVSGAANTTANIKNLLTSAQLGATAGLAAATDPYIARAARKLANLPVTSTIGKMLDQLKRSSREEIIRSGVIWDEYLHVMGDELRFAGPAVGSEWSRWLADRGVTWSGLKPLTTGRKLVEARAWQAHIADLARQGKTFGKLDKRFRTVLEGFGVTAEDWSIWTRSIDANGFVTARQIELNGGPVQYLDRAGFDMADPAHIAETTALAHREAAEKLAEVITSWSERSVPTGTVNARSAVTGLAKRGTIQGELIDYMLQYKSFGLSFTSLQLEAIGEMAAARGGGLGRRTGVGYFASLVVPVTLAAAVWLQIKNLLDGKQPEDMTRPGFFVKAAVSGGGFGLFGDFAQASENRFGGGFGETLSGPGITFLGDSFGLTVGNLMELTRGEDTHTGRDAVRYIGRYTPVVSSHWATRGAWRRVVLDNLQWLADPEADRSFKAQAARAKRNGAAFWLPPGSLVR